MQWRTCLLPLPQCEPPREPPRCGDVPSRWIAAAQGLQRPQGRFDRSREAGGRDLSELGEHCVPPPSTVNRGALSLPVLAAPPSVPRQLCTVARCPDMRRNEPPAGSTCVSKGKVWTEAW
jgi:hypothetical protein